VKFTYTVAGVSRSVDWPIDIVAPSMLVQRPLTREPALPALAKWNENMLVYGRKNCEVAMSPGVETGMWYYDGQRIAERILAQTNDPYWATCAATIQSVYAPAVLANKGYVPAWRVFPDGLLATYRRTGDTQAKEAALALARNSPLTMPNANTTYNVSAKVARETAYAIIAHLAGQEMGEPVSPDFSRLVDVALGHLDQWYVQQSMVPQPAFAGLLSEALIRVHAKTADPRIPPAIQRALDFTWEKQFDQAAGKIAYVEYSVTPPTASYTADLNMLIAPAFGWMYQQTGDPRYRERGDAMFTGSVNGSFLAGGKQYSQTYRWGPEYLEWRKGPAGPTQAERIAAAIADVQKALESLQAIQ
jgi:hypothetical protein